MEKIDKIVRNVMSELSSQPTSVQSAYGWHSENRIFVNRRYQRKLVWTLHEKQKLVESVMKRYPIPAILFAEKGDVASQYEVIDGLQRLNALISFIEGAFPTVDGRFFDISLFPTAKANLDEEKFAPLSQAELINNKEVSTILDYSLAFSIMRNATDEEVDDVFDRINSYGHRLSEQERRQSGIQNEFSEMVRQLACKVRGDQSARYLPISKMPEISIDLPMMKHGYDIKAESVFWVQQGILNSNDLRDSMDEQCIADIAASIISGTVLERSKDTLDAIYARGSEESNQLNGAMAVYGIERFSAEFDYCVNQIELVCQNGQEEKLRSIIYEHRTSNAFPAVFSLIFIAIHELFTMEKKSISDYSLVKAAISNLTRRIDTSRRSTSSDERRKNIDAIKALISPKLSPIDPAKDMLANHSALDVDGFIRSSGMELSRFELKQGILELHGDRKINADLLDRLVETVCGIANNGPKRTGQVILGVSDTQKDAARAEELDGVRPRSVGTWNVVGIDREARALGIPLEKYHQLVRNHFEKSKLSEPLKSNVLSSIDYNPYYGLGVLVITVPAQKEPSYVADEMFWRDGDNTKAAKGAKLIADIGRRF